MDVNKQLDSHFVEENVPIIPPTYVIFHEGICVAPSNASFDPVRGQQRGQGLKGFYARGRRDLRKIEPPVFAYLSLSCCYRNTPSILRFGTKSSRSCLHRNRGVGRLGRWPHSAIPFCLSWPRFPSHRYPENSMAAGFSHMPLLLISAYHSGPGSMGLRG